MAMTYKFVSNPVTIEAFQIPVNDEDIDSFQEGAEAIGFINGIDWEDGRNGTIEVYTLEGVMVAKPGDWIIKGTIGEFYPCVPEVFERKYRPYAKDRNEGISIGDLRRTLIEMESRWDDEWVRHLGEFEHQQLLGEHWQEGQFMGYGMMQVKGWWELGLCVVPLLHEDT